VSKSPEKIRQTTAMTTQALRDIDNFTGEAFNRATDLLDDITREDYPEAYPLLQESLQTLKRADVLFNRVYQLNIEYYKSVNDFEEAERAEAAKNSSNDLDQLVEQVKAAMAGADPGTNVVFVVRKEADPISFKMSELEGELSKRSAGFEARKGLFT
jgi:hypothetical protein